MVDGLAEITERRSERDAGNEILRDLLRGWRLMLLLPLVALAGTLALLWSVQPEFTAVMVVGPTSTSGFAAMGARIPQPGREAASAAEQGTGSESLSDFARYLHLLTSVPVAERLMADPRLVQRMFPERWDAEAGRWMEPAGATAALRRLLFRLAGREDWVLPDAGAVVQYLRRRIVVEPVGTSAMRRVRFRHSDRGFALAFLRALGEQADAHLRGEARRRTTAQLEFADALATTVTHTEHRKVFAELRNEQQRVLVMLDVGLPFAADVVEAPSADALPDWPDPTMVLIVALAGGLSVGVMAAAFGATRRSWARGR